MKRFLFIGMSLCAGLLGACREVGVLDPHGPVSQAERLILFNSTVIMLVVVAPVIVLTLAFAWWYRRGNTRATYDPEFTYSGSIELTVWAIPAMVVILLAGVAWIGAHDLDPPRRVAAPGGGEPLHVQVVSLDWKWLFIYPDQGIATVNELVVPAGTSLEFSLTSATVMNSFFIPQLGSQIYTMPGMTTRLNLLADHPGEFAGLSAQFSGDGFSDMRFPVRAVPAAEFEQWVAQTRERGAPLDIGTYDEVAKPSSNVQPTLYSRVAANLFANILTESTAMQPAPPKDK